MKKIIAALVVFVVIGAGWWIYQHQQTKSFRESVIPIYNSYKVLIDDGNKSLESINGRSYDNVFREFGDIKQKNQELKMKAASMTPPTEDGRKLHSQLLKTLTVHDDALISLISLFETERAVKINSYDKNSDAYKESVARYKAAVDKRSTTAASSRAERRALQAAIGIDVEPEKTP